MITDELLLVESFVIIGLFTFLFKAIFLYHIPSLLQNKAFKNGLDSVLSVLLVAFVIPYTFFVLGSFLPFRIETLSIVLTAPVIYYIKRPGLSLPIAIVLFVLFGFIFTNM